MKNRRKRGGLNGGDVVLVSWRRFFRFVALFVFSFVLFSALFIFLGNKTINHKAVLGGSVPRVKVVTIHETVEFPDQTLIFLNYPPASRLLTKEDLFCVFSDVNDSSKLFKELPFAVETDDNGRQIVRCSAVPRDNTVSLAVSRWTVGNNKDLLVETTHRWDWLVYDAVIDDDNSTVVFVKGLNLRPGKVADVSRYECVYGWDFTKPKLLLRAQVISAAQEIVRCKTPLTVLDGPRTAQSQPVKVSVRIKGSEMLPSVAQPIKRPGRVTDSKPFETCVCTMTRNAANVLREWVMYHGKIGVQRWFIYDNNSDDDIVSEIKNLENHGYNVSRHFWPWIKTQEAGFANCAIRAKRDCDWVAFIDVDEFFYIPSGQTLTDVIRNHTIAPSLSIGEIGEIRTPCHSFGPSGLRDRPREGVTTAYTCRMTLPERHKSIIRPESLNATLINVVHHFHLRDGFTFADVDKGTMVINHYKYQVWDVFKEKFKRRVATYVADWQNEENVGSKDRAPGLGTRPVEPSDWAERFCEVRDTGLQSWVLENFRDRKTHRLVWERERRRVEDEVIVQMGSWADKRVGRKRKKQLKAQ
ncbi:PREDICTED: glycosyltransferase family 92 protein RCOM_0530710-like isoform X2 [Camelina sativa]|uniref:Glycosyltransferase family 92 protein n=1 Tax=Camelina sativa TaxID=90675 RepID=A0ABM1QMW1_CAMSA|nr:PREDICTED: glycosyltransferase family 92 protein RCOM_0530710-like isoform X1 [Camelina sativa]XP_019088099.1 PREDICTED: glycosyltransferase family 92 protein RCOM_0530710-like isoform X2 [Camelina sativa]